MLVVLLMVRLFLLFFLFGFLRFLEYFSVVYFFGKFSCCCENAYADESAELLPPRLSTGAASSARTGEPAGAGAAAGGAAGTGAERGNDNFAYGYYDRYDLDFSHGLCLCFTILYHWKQIARRTACSCVCPTWWPCVWALFECCDRFVRSDPAARDMSVSPSLPHDTGIELRAGVASSSVPNQGRMVSQQSDASGSSRNVHGNRAERRTENIFGCCQRRVYGNRAYLTRNYCCCLSPCHICVCGWKLKLRWTTKGQTGFHFINE